MASPVLFAHVPRTVLVRGDFDTGKTTYLIREVITLLAEGTPAADIVVFAASPLAADDLAARLRAQAATHEDAAVAEAAAKGRVTVPRAYMLEALATPEAQAITGRDARLLNSFEYDFLLEDLKTSTIPPKRLSEMMKFFNRQFSELRDFEEDWLYTVEERELYELIENCLGFMRGIISSELAGLFVRVAQGGAAKQVPYVFADDFRTLSRGSQIALSMLASARLTVTDNPLGVLKVFEDYPYAEGLDELEEENVDLETVTLTETHCSAAGYAAADKLLHAAAVPMVWADDLNMAGWNESAAQQAKGIKDVQLPAFAGGGAQTVDRADYDTPQEEFLGVADYVAARIAEGCAPGDIVVAGTQRMWQRNIGIALSNKGIPVAEQPAGRAFVGDIRDFAYCDAHQVYTALALLADPSDCVAWRSWLGFGDYLTNSNGMKLLRERAALGGKALDAALEMLPTLAENATLSEGKLSCERMQAAVERCKELYERCAGLAGSALLQEVVAFVLGEDAKMPALITKLVGPVGGADQSLLSARVFVERAKKRLQYPSCSPEAVRVIPYDQVIGVAPKVLVVPGFVNGFMPKHDFLDPSELTQTKREQRRGEDLLRAVRVFSSATERIAVSTFARADIEVAERTRIYMDRIGLLDGRRVSYTQPSILLEYL